MTTVAFPPASNSDAGAESITLDAQHVYRLGERIIPSVTQIIGAVIRPLFYGATDWHMDRGTALHSAIALDADGVLDRESLDDAIKGRFSAYEKYLDDSKAEIIEAEIPLYSKRYGFAGTLDAVVEYKIGKVGLVDWKSTATATADLQIAAYSILWRESGSGGVIDDDYSCAVQLNDDGSYRTRFVTDLKRAERRFLACLTVYNFMAENGLLPKGEQQ